MGPWVGCKRSPDQMCLRNMGGEDRPRNSQHLVPQQLQDLVPSKPSYTYSIWEHGQRHCVSGLHLLYRKMQERKEKGMGGGSMRDCLFVTHAWILSRGQVVTSVGVLIYPTPSSQFPCNSRRCQVVHVGKKFFSQHSVVAIIASDAIVSHSGLLIF